MPTVLGDTKRQVIMSRRRRRDRRETFDFSNRRLPVSSNYSVTQFYNYRTPLTLFEDRRQWHPEGIYAPARSFSQTRHRLVPVIGRSPIKQRPGRAWYPGFQGREVIAFRAPQKTLICVRRKIRKEVLHAFRKTGRGGQRSPKFNHYSSISCRR